MDAEKRNPFEYEKANSLKPEQIAEFFIDDHNFSRFLPTGKNIILKGARGTGKTMAMMYFSFKVRYTCNKTASKPVEFDKIGIHIPCKNPIYQKQEYLLPRSNEFESYIVAEHFLALNITYEIFKTLKDVEELKVEGAKLTKIKSKLEFILDFILPNDWDMFEAVMLYAQKESNKTQKCLNNQDFDSFFEISYSFNSLIMPLLDCLQDIELLNSSHFMFMLDDVQDLNIYQQKVINSWIAFRDNKHFSFKLATTSKNPLLITSSGGTILENHDFISIDMIKSFQTKGRDFYELAKKIIQKRLDLFEINATVEEFLPVNPNFKKGLEESNEIARQKAHLKYPNPSGTQISDHISKYGRAEYFRSRPPQSNKPPYSGLDTLIDVSTGVIRHLLIPIYWMYDKELSKQSGSTNYINCIPSGTQTEIILDESKKYWERLRNIHMEVENCTEEQAIQIYCFFDNLMVLFRERLLDPTISEPRAITFIISASNDELMEKINPILDIAIRGNYLFTRLANAKNEGKQDVYYIPNRFLIPARGLDPHGQYARVSLKAQDIVNAAYNNKKIPNAKNDEDGQQYIQFE